jgi:hypothetical protein
MELAIIIALWLKPDLMLIFISYIKDAWNTLSGKIKDRGGKPTPISTHTKLIKPRTNNYSA